MSGRISIIIPAIDEEADLEQTLRAAAFGDPAEIIVVDGGSRDRTPQIAEGSGARLIRSAPGRARQMNLGARESAGDCLLFLHADTILPSGYSDHVIGILSQPGVVAGAFRLHLDGAARGLRAIERLANWRSQRLQMPYGDQAIFLRASIFDEAGGFPDLPLMEDFELMRRLRRRGRILIAPIAVRSSARRWNRLGVLRTTLVNQAVILGYLMGVSPARLARWYRGWQGRQASERQFDRPERRKDVE